MLKAFVPALVWALIILYLSTRGGVNLPQKITDLVSVDKIGHLTFYFVFTILISRGFYQSVGIDRTKLMISIGIAVIYGILMEFIQFRFFPNRYFEVLDIVADIIGSLISLIFIRKLFLK